MVIILKKISWVVLFLTAFVLGLKQLHEPDLWWMFRTGEWMVQNGEIPTVDPFSFTLKGTEWISVKWLFELIAYGFAYFIGPESISILQGLVNVLMVYFFIHTIRNFTELIYGITLQKFHPGLVLASTLFLFAIDYRLVGRPEMFSYLLALIYLSIFIQYKYKPGKFVYWLVPLQIIWVNIHEGYAVGIVMLLAFGFGFLFDSFVTKKGNKKEVTQAILVTILAILAVAVNPRGFYMFYHPYFLFSVVGTNHYTTEFNSVFYRPGFYFSFKEPYIAFGSFIVTIVGISWFFLKSKLQIFNKISSGYIAIIFAFLYLGMTAYRMVIFPIITLLPFVFVLIIGWVNKWKDSKPFKVFAIVSYTIPFLFYISIGSNLYYETFQNRDRYGLAVYSESNPAGASKFAKEYGLNDKRCFSDYLSSAYFLWDLRPGFESYIDLRDLDIFPESFFDEFIRITHFTNFFENSDSKYEYEYAMLYTWQFPNLHRYLYHSPNWQQVYADNIAVVYVKNNTQNIHLIQQFNPDSTNLLGNFNAAFQPKPNAISNGISYTLWPFYTLRPTQVDSSIMASKYFRIVADFDRAEFHAQNAIKNNTSAYEGWNELGNMYLEIVPYKRTQEGKMKYISMANSAFSNGLKLDRKRWECSFGMANCAFMEGDFAYALKLYKKAQRLDQKNASNYIKIADCYANLYQANSNQKDIDHWFENMNLALKMDPDNRSILTKLAIAYCQRNECDKANPLLKNYERTAETSEEEHQEVMKCKKKCLGK